MSRIRNLAAMGCLLATASFLMAQRYTSPPANAKGTVAGKQVTIDYYAPSMHGRKIIGALVPYGRVWCPGANVATGITADSDLQIGNLKLVKGMTYSIWILPTEKDWTLILNKQSGQHHLDYDSDRDLGRTKMTLKTLSAPVETLRYEIRPDGGNKGTLAVQWETTEASVPFTILK